MAYRDDQRALAQRLADLEARLAGLRRTRNSLHTLASEEQSAVDELRALRKQLAPSAAELKRRLPLVQQVYVASPCDMPWDSMAGDDKTRFCNQCEKSVHNLSAMTTPEAEALLASSCGGSLCVRLYRRDDGTVLTADCPVGLRRKQRRRLAAAAAFTLALSGGLASAMAALKTPPPAAQTPAPATVLAAPTPLAQVPVAPPVQAPPEARPIQGGLRRVSPPPPQVAPRMPRHAAPAAPVDRASWVMGGEG